MDYSVLMSVYKKDNPAYFKQALQSMIDQTVPPSEIVIVEDGELNEPLYTMIAFFAKKYKGLIVRVSNPINVGLGKALNIGLKVCKHEFVARMDTDDISKSSRCAKQLACFDDKPYLAIVGAHIDEFVGDTNNVVSTRRVPITNDEIYQFGKRRNPFNHPVVMFRKSSVMECGGYSDMPKSQDMELFGRMLYAGYKAENINEPLLWFRCDKNFIVKRTTWEEVKSNISVVYKFFKMGYSGFLDLIAVSVTYCAMLILPDFIVKYMYKMIRV